ncbi:MAG: peptide chain release factor 3, partial [Desulfopila sp.]
TARWVTCDDRKRFDEFQKKNQNNLATDAEGHLTYLASSEWRLQNTMEQWEGVMFHKSREHS